MSAQFGRVISLIAATSTDALDLSALRITFAIKQWDIQTPNSATIRIWNPADATVKALQSEFTRIVLQVGYQDGDLGTLFDGTIVQTFAGRENATDTYLTIIASDGDEAYNFSVSNQTLAAGATPNDQIQALIGNLGAYGVKPGYLQSLTGGPLPRAKVQYGMSRDQIRQVTQSSGANWSIQNGAAQVMSITSYLPGQAVVLSSATGLIGFPQQTAGGITARCLINPRVRVGGRVQIDNAAIQKATVSLQYTALNFLPRVTDDGFYRVIVANHTGDSRGNDWYSDLICIALDDAVQPDLAAKGYG